MSPFRFCLLAIAFAASQGALGGSLPPTPEDVLELPAELKNKLQTRILDVEPVADRRLDRLASFMFSADGLNFRYTVGPTQTVAETYADNAGNCLSFTLMFLAMADFAGIEASPREVHVPTRIRQDGVALFESGHVNVYVDTGRRRAIVDFEPDPILSRRLSTTRRGTLISRQLALAHFYNNRAAELLAGGQAQDALAWSKQALKLAPDFIAALNNRGVIEARLNNIEAAHGFYRQALDREPHNLSTLFNLLKLHRHLGQVSQAQSIIERLETLDSRDPFFHWSMAQNYEYLGELRRARRRYERAVHLNPDKAMFHADLARAAELLGDHAGAETALFQALRISHRDPAQNLTLDDRLRALKSGMMLN